MITKTVILGMLAKGQMHGYEIKRRVKELLGESADINFGSIYYGLKSYVKKGWVDHLGDEPGKGSPERSIYKITAEGQNQLAVFLEKNLSNTQSPLSSFEVGLALAEYLPENRSLEILEKRYLDIKASYDKALSQDIPKNESKNEKFVREYRLYRLGAEVHWMKNLLPQLK